MQAMFLVGNLRLERLWLTPHPAADWRVMPGRHHRPRPKRSPLIPIALTAALLVGIPLGIFAVYRVVSQNTCAGQPKLKVAAAPEIADAVRKAATGPCINVEVTPADPADVAAAIAGKFGVALAGVGLPGGDAQLPDVWIADSSTWLARLQHAVPDLPTSEIHSVASSPVVLAMPEPVASTLGWPATRLTWQTLLQQVSTNTQLNIGTAEPTRDAAGLSGLLALGGAASALPEGQAAATGTLRTLAAGRSTLRQDLLARFPRSTDPASIASALSAAALSEQAVIAYNAAKPPIRLAALYLDPAPISLDYPFTVLNGQSTATGKLLEALKRPEFRDGLAATGLRGPDGTPGATFTAPEGAPAPVLTPAPTPAQKEAMSAAVDQALNTWIAVTLPARMLAVIDVSGSMLERVPTAGNATRAQVTVEAARRGLGLFDDNWAVGLWIFSTNLNGTVDHLELAPIGPLASQRGALLAKLGTVTPVPDGDTGLYDTLLAGYQAVQKDWDPGEINSVVVLTDGDNDDANGISLPDLQNKLKEIVDPNRPIQLVILGIGPEVNAAPLEEITKITGGGVFVATDPAKIDEIFLKAISLRSAPR